ncbi:unnamed protein product [Paramecium pentaurelia]|uniref:B box-type domain-containing protein n=1 Tax=Paramecium pentaurelia TaxID=43138 RepID=A0A8S1Y8I3_9CILI|nr:unnamed protein product [Paramecium pentaurelia]
MIDNQKYICQEHKIEATLICCISQWHCEPLCVECIPNHTMQHNKNKTQSQIKKYQDVEQECQQKFNQFNNELETLKNQIIQEINNPYEDDNLKNLKLWKDQYLSFFESYFNNLIADYNLKLKQFKQNQTDQFQKVIQNIEKLSNQYQTLKSELNIYTLSKQKELDQLKDNFQQIQQLKIKQNYSLNLFEQQQIKNKINDLILIEDNDQKEQIQQKQVKKDFVPQKSTVCPQCGTQMTYVSDFKKHMECPKCTKIKRPNTLKK